MLPLPFIIDKNNDSMQLQKSWEKIKQMEAMNKKKFNAESQGNELNPQAASPTDEMKLSLEQDAKTDESKKEVFSQFVKLVRLILCGIYFLLYLITIFFFTRPKVKAQFGK